MKQVICLTLPFPPSGNSSFRTGKFGNYTSAKVKEYRAQVKEIVKLNGADKMLAGRLHVEVDCYFPTQRKGDLDNRFKTLADALTHAGVWVDDEQLDRVVLERMNVVKGGLVAVRICEVSQ